MKPINLSSELLSDFQGEVKIVRSSRARHIRFTLEPFSPLQITIPAGANPKDVKEALNARSQWIQNARKKMQAYEKKVTNFKPGCSYKTMMHEIKIVQGKSLSFEEGFPTSIIRVPEKSVQSAQVQIRKWIEKLLYEEAKNYLPQRTLELADHHSFKTGKVSVRNNKSRWGSCSANNNISLNIHLMRLPSELIDYVIMHELCHIKIKNHSPRFWNELSEVLPDARKLDKRLNAFSTNCW